MKIDNYGNWTPIVDKIRTVANKYNLKTYIVGGFVRDLLLGRKPKDLDMMVEGEGGGMKLAELIHQEIGGHAPVLFPRFGTAKLTIDDQDVEFVAPRKEFYEEDNRKPKTEVGDLWDDAMRRDFSVNALFININNNEVIDLTGHGLEDLQNHILRVTDTKNPDVIMTQDPLRMLRLIRQSSQLNFSIDPDTYDAVKRNAAKINTISKERVQEELNKMLLTDKPSRALLLLRDSGLMNYVLPDLSALEGTEEEGANDSKNVWSHTLQVVDNSPKNLVVRLAALFHDMGKPATKSRTYSVSCPKCSEKVEYTYKTQPNIGIVCTNGTCGGNRSFKTEKELMEAFPRYDVHFYDHERVGADKATKVLRELRYSDDIITAVKALITHHMKGHAYSEDWTDSAVRRYDRETNPHTNELLDLTEADVTSKHPEKRKKNTERIQKLRERIKLLNEQAESAKMQSPLDGNDLMAIYNRKPGVWLSKVKNYLLNEVIEGRLQQDDKEGAKRMLENVDIDTLASSELPIRMSRREV